MVTLHPLEPRKQSPVPDEYWAANLEGSCFKTLVRVVAIADDGSQVGLHVTIRHAKNDWAWFPIADVNFLHRESIEREAAAPPPRAGDGRVAFDGILAKIKARMDARDVQRLAAHDVDPDPTPEDPNAPTE